MVHPGVYRQGLLDLGLGAVKMAAEEVEGVDAAASTAQTRLLWTKQGAVF